MIAHQDDAVTIYCGDSREVLKTLPDQSINCCVTSPPYFGLRDYGYEWQIGLEATPDDYIEGLMAVFREVHRVLRDDGTVWVNLGDTYNHDSKWGGSSSNKNELKQGYARKQGRDRDSGCKEKDLLGIPWLFAFAMRNEGWFLRQDIIWHKPNPMPESVQDRCTKAHEYIFLLSKSRRYYFNAEAIREPAAYAGQSRGGSTNRYEQNAAGMDCKEYDERNKRSVWSVNPKPYKGAHFATFPPELIKPCILAGCPAGGTVLDPFMGSGTTAAVARDNGCKAVGIELNPEYCKLIAKRLGQRVLSFTEG